MGRIQAEHDHQPFEGMDDETGPDGQRIPHPMVRLMHVFEDERAAVFESVPPVGVKNSPMTISSAT